MNMGKTNNLFEFPAPAGINRFCSLQNAEQPRVPRVSEDKPDALDAMMDITWSSPPLR